MADYQEFLFYAEKRDSQTEMDLSPTSDCSDMVYVLTRIFCEVTVILIRWACFSATDGNEGEAFTGSL